MKKLLAFAGLLTVAAISFGQTSPFDINWSTYKSGQYSKITTFSKFVMRSQADFQDYWAKSTGNPARTAPNDIDWLKYEVLAIHLGTRSSGGYTASVRDVQMVRGNEYNVQVVEQVPARGGMTTEALTSPFTIILLPRRYAMYNVAVVKESAGGWDQGDHGNGGGGGNGGGHGDHDQDDGRKDGYRLIERGELSNGPRQMAMDVVRSQGEWNRFWDRVRYDSDVNVYGRSRERQIDWEHNRVLILQFDRSYSGATIEISKVKKTEGGFQVFVTQRLGGYQRADHFQGSPYIVIEVAGKSGKFDVKISQRFGA